VDAHLREILDLLIRWVHLIAGIMWIGNSMLWNWLDRNLEKPDPPDELQEGHIWMVHSGGFYEMKKLQLEPNQMPAKLHWFWIQATTTWASGFLLLIVVYWLGGRAAMVDAGVADLSQGMAIAVSFGLLVLGWLFYDLLWRSPLGKNTPAAAAVSVVALVGVIYGLTHVFNGKAAFLHVGAMLGTLMVSNVWHHILPSQRELVRLTQEGKRQEMALGKRAKQRSIHNNYMTFPVLFTMLSSHFPSTYGNANAWIVLCVLLLAGALVRHWMNIRFTWGGWLPALAATVVVGVGALWFLTKPAPAAADPTAAPVAFAQAQGIVQARCATCHATKPTDPMFASAAAGVALDTPERIKGLAERIKARAVDTTSMPLGNKTGMTAEERATLGRWIAQGAPLQ
jgi:uncharacterized membrane protein